MLQNPQFDVIIDETEIRAAFFSLCARKSAMMVAFSGMLFASAFLALLHF